MQNILNRYYITYKQTPLAARAALWFVICSMLQKCISIITVPIFTRLMPTDQYGAYSTFLSWYGIITVFCTLNMEYCAYINGITKTDDQAQKDETAVSLLSLSATITILIFLIYFIFRHYLDKIIGLPTVMIVLIFAEIFFDPPVNFWSIQQRYEFRYIKLVVRTISMVLLNAILGIIFVLLADQNQAVMRAVSIFLVQFVFGGIFFIYFFKRAKKLFICRDWKHALAVQIPLLPHGLTLTVLASADRIMINSMVGPLAAGIYSVAYSAGYIVFILKNSIVDAMKPWIYENINKQRFEEIRKNTKPILILNTLITFVFVAFAPEIIKIMAPAKYYEAIYVIPPVAASSFFTFLYNLFVSIEFYYEETKKTMLASIGGAALNIFLNFICIPVFGYMAAGYTTLVSYMFFSVAHYMVMRSICKRRLNDVRIFGGKFILILSVMILAFTLLFSFYYENILIRYGIISVIILVVFIKRKTFVNSVMLIKKR